MAKQPVVGLGDISFDPSLQTDEVDHDFFDNPVTFGDEETSGNLESSPMANSTNNGVNSRPSSDTQFRPGMLGYPLEPIKVITELPYQQNLNYSNQVFSTETLLACLNASNEPCSSTSEQIFVEEPSEDNRLKHPNQEFKLFDISDSSSDGSGDESEQELNNFLEKYYDLLDVEDTDNSDFTEVSPMSSLTVSPLPPGCVGEAEDSNGIIDGVGNIGTQVGEENCNPSIQTNLIEDAVVDPTSLISQLPGRLPSVISTTTGAVNTFQLEANRDLNQNGDRSPSVSSFTSAQNSSSSVSVSSISSRRSGSSTSSSISSTGGKKMGRNFTFTPDQLKRIEKENGILLKKIIDTQRHGHHHHHSHHHHGYRSPHRTTGHRSVQCSASIARQRQQRRIDHENLMLMKKIQNAKPSRDIGDAFKTAKA